jgi:hypothetical protein
MWRSWIIVVTLLAIGAASAESPEPSREAVAAAARSCTADGAFGHRFGEKTSARGTDTGIAPFRIESLSRRGDGLFEIVAVAWFGKAPMSGEDRIALANWVFGALDAEAAKRGFARRDERRDGVTYHSSADVATGYTLDLSHDGVNVRIDCTDVALKRRAWSQMRRER